MCDSTTPILTSVADGVQTITLNRPEALNALEPELMAHLWQSLLQARKDPQVVAVVITGQGRAFCAGGDLRILYERSPDRSGDSFRELAAGFHQVINEIRTTPLPVVAAINGPAAGGGFSLALCCDLRVMSEGAFLQQAYTSNGLSPDGGGSFFLPRLVGLAKAMEIVMLDERMNAATCERLGLANFVVPGDEVVVRAIEVCRNITKRSLYSVAKAKELLNQAYGNGLGDQLERERHGIADAADSPEGREGVTAFLGKRKPNFAGVR